MAPIGNLTCNLLACSTVPQPVAPPHSPEKYIQVCNQQIALIKHLYMCPLFVCSHLQGISILMRHLQLLYSLPCVSGKKYDSRPQKLLCIVLYRNVKILLSSSSASSLLSYLCWLFTIIYTWNKPCFEGIECCSCFVFTICARCNVISPMKCLLLSLLLYNTVKYSAFEHLEIMKSFQVKLSVKFLYVATLHLCWHIRWLTFTSFTFQKLPM